MGYRLAHHRHLMAPLRQRQIGPTAHHRVRVAARQDTDRRCSRGGIGHSQFADAEGFHPVGSELAGEMHAGQQHRLRLLAAHRRRPGDIPATAGHFEVNQARQRVGIDADIHYLHPGPGLRRQHADAGVAPHHIAGMNGRHPLRRRGHAFMPDAMVGAHDHNRFLRQRQLPLQARQTGQLHRQRLQTAKAAGRL